MKKVLKIKWELIIGIMLGITTITSWSLWEEIRDWRILVLILISMTALIVWIICYNQIKDFRKQIYKMW